jgi:DNA-binding NtrC family response regulator
MNRRVLFVDDEPAVLVGIKRNLRNDFEIETETDPRKALATLDPTQPYAAIVADMRMPGMDGVEFLHEVKKISPLSVRLMLTGDTARQTSIDALNRAGVFKLVAKPCEAELLRQIVELAVRQHEIEVAAQKAVLERALRRR